MMAMIIKLKRFVYMYVGCLTKDYEEKDEIGAEFNVYTWTERHDECKEAHICMFANGGLCNTRDFLNNGSDPRITFEKGELTCKIQNEAKSKIRDWNSYITVSRVLM